MTLLSTTLWLTLAAAPEPVDPPSPAHLWLSWSIPEDALCPTREMLVAEIRRVRGSVELVELPEAADVVATARVTELEPDQWVVDVETVAAAVTGQRRLEAESCGQAAEAVAVVLALALDQRAEQDKAAAPPAPPARVPMFQLSTFAQVIAGPWPSASWAAGLAVSLRWHWLRIELAVASAPINQSYSLVTPIIGSLPFVALPRVCAVAQLGSRFEGEACLELPAGAMRAEGVFSQVVSTAPWLAIWAAAAARVQVVKWLWLGARGGGGLSFVRPQLLGGGREIYVVPPGSGYGALSVEFRF